MFRIWPQKFNAQNVFQIHELGVHTDIFILFLFSEIRLNINKYSTIFYTDVLTFIINNLTITIFVHL